MLINRFPSVVGGGANGAIVHYSRHDKIVSCLLHLLRSLTYISMKIRYGRMLILFCFVNQIGHEALVLMDVGCEYQGYVSDMTRTWPPCGYFTAARVIFLHKFCIWTCLQDVLNLQSGNIWIYIDGLYPVMLRDKFTISCWM